MGSEAQQQQLCDRYGYNPLALKIVATSIQELFEGEIGEFLAQDTAVFNGVQKLLDQQFNRLSPLEQTIMYWLAINREVTTIYELAADIVPAVSQPQLLEALESLRWRSLIEKATPILIEKQSSGYTQQPVVMEYVTQRLVEQIYEELLVESGALEEWRSENSQRQKVFKVQNPKSIDERSETSRRVSQNSPSPPLSLFQSHALLKTTVQDYVRESQIRLILQPIANQLRTTFQTAKALEEKIQAILGLLARRVNAIRLWRRQSDQPLPSSPI